MTGWRYYIAHFAVLLGAYLTVRVLGAAVTAHTFLTYRDLFAGACFLFAVWVADEVVGR